MTPAIISTTSAYVDRPEHSKAIAAGLSRPCRNKKFLAHALAITGLGGSSKTELASHYVEQHKADYDTISWLDVQRESVTRSSFERCCHALSLVFEKQPPGGLLSDAPCVQELLKWLRDRNDDQPWLIILDNADDLDKLDATVPQGVAGSVLLVSRDGDAGRLLHDASNVRVDSMEAQEAVSLLRTHMDMQEGGQNQSILFLMTKLVKRLDCIALAIDLAGRWLKSDMDDRLETIHTKGQTGSADRTNDLTTAALQRYFDDLSKYEETLLSGNPYSRYKKTIRTVWKATFTALKAVEDDSGPNAPVFPAQLLQLLTTLGQLDVPRELFRSASESFEQTKACLKFDLPSWFKSLLRRDADGTWNDFTYRESIKHLKRFGLVRTTSIPIYVPQFLGVSMSARPSTVMHGLVQQRASAEADECDGHEKLRLVLLTASCFACSNYVDIVDFSEQLQPLLPVDSTLPLFRGKGIFREDRLGEVCMAFGLTWLVLRQFRQAELLLNQAYHHQRSSFGHQSSKTIQAKAEFRKIPTQLLSLKEPEFKKIEPYTLEDLTTEAWAWTAASMDESLGYAYTPSQRESQSITRQHQALLSLFPGAHLPQPPRLEAEQALRESIRDKIKPFLLQGLHAAQRLWGGGHPLVVQIKSNLASTHGLLLEAKEEETLVRQVLAYESQPTNLGKKHSKSLQTLARLAHVLHGRKYDEAFDLMSQCAAMSAQALGGDDPRTVERYRVVDDWRSLQSPINNEREDEDEEDEENDDDDIA